MSWPPDIAEDLPNPQEDDPPSLRADILDELADHLSCAFTRELHFTADESRAKENVLDRFGNPGQIARKLWFDALKEKVMTQRFNLVLSSLMTAACLAAVVVSWQMLREGREVNNALLAAIKELADRPAPVAESPKSMDWNPVKIKLVLEKKGGAPAVGYKASLTGNVYAESGGQIDVVSDENGLVDFGFVRFGRHRLTITSSWGAHHFSAISVRPGVTSTSEVFCPARPLEAADVSCRMEWPDVWKEANPNLWALCNFLQEPQKLDESTVWFNKPDHSFQFVIRPNGKILSIGDGITQNGNRFDFSRFDAEPVETVSWPASRYDLVWLSVFSPTEQGDSSQTLPENNRIHLSINFESPFSRLTESIIEDNQTAHGGGGFFMLAPQLQSELAPRFEAKAGVMNRWSIKLPEKAIRALNDKH